MAEALPPHGDDSIGNEMDFQALAIGESDEEKVDEELPLDQPTCYCNQIRNFDVAELLCANCNKWFHEICIEKNIGKIASFLTNYVFICKDCSTTGTEIFLKRQAQFIQFCVTALANLQYRSHKYGVPRNIFNKELEIIPFIHDNWDSITTTAKRLTQRWHADLNRTLTRNLHTLFLYVDDPVEGQGYGLANTDLRKIKPDYEQMIRSGLLKRTDNGVELVGPTMTRKGKNTKRKIASEAGTSKRGRARDAASDKLPWHGYPMDHPFNKDGYRYLLAEPDPHAPFRKEFDESNDLAGKPIPSWLYRVVIAETVLLALHDRAPQLKVSDSRLQVIGEKGYSTVRATHGVSQGCWYWEADITDLPPGAAVRLGWGQEYANLQAPLGYDKYGYSWRSRKGTKFHQACGKSYSAGYGTGDVIGFLIYFPESQNAPLVSSYKDRPLVKVKSHFYYEDKDDLVEYAKTCKNVPGSKIVFFKNGISQGEAFLDIFSGTYYPGLSLHKSGTVTANFGPNFKHFPNELYPEVRGMHLRPQESIVEHSCADMLYLTLNEGKLRLDSVVKYR